MRGRKARSQDVPEVLLHDPCSFRRSRTPVLHTILLDSKVRFTDLDQPTFVRKFCTTGTFVPLVGNTAAGGSRTAVQNEHPTILGQSSASLLLPLRPRVVLSINKSSLNSIMTHSLQTQQRMMAVADTDVDAEIERLHWLETRDRPVLDHQVAAAA